MVRDADGVWSVTGEPAWVDHRYRFEVTVYTPHHQRVVVNQVTDPYSVALTVNSTHSVLVDLDDPGLVPGLWRDTPATWRTDAILAATQAALLPESPAELREGWIRVAPDTGNDDT